MRRSLVGVVMFFSYVLNCRTGHDLQGRVVGL